MMAGDIEITLVRRGRPDTHGFVRQLDVFGVTVGLGVHNNRPDTQLTAGSLNAQGDFAAIGDEDFPEHGGNLLSQ